MEAIGNNGQTFGQWHSKCAVGLLAYRFLCKNLLTVLEVLVIVYLVYWVYGWVHFYINLDILIRVLHGALPLTGP